jgi:transcriptional regulator with XRE-family HTH domain
MTGQHILNLLKQEGYSVNKMAEMIGRSQQNLATVLKHTDIRTGLLEDIAKAMGKPLSFFYGEAFGPVSVASGDRSTSVQVGGDATNVATSADDRLLSLLVSKDEQLTMAMRQTSKAQEQMDRTQSHMERILDTFCEAKNK